MGGSPASAGIDPDDTIDDRTYDGFPRKRGDRPL